MSDDRYSGYCEPFKDLEGQAGRVGLLAAGGGALREASILLFERGAYGSSGGRAIA